VCLIQFNKQVYSDIDASYKGLTAEARLSGRVKPGFTGWERLRGMPGGYT